MSSKVKKLTLKNYFLVSNQRVGLESLQGWLSKLKLHGSESRARTRFMKLLMPRVDEIEKERMEMLERHAETKGKGEKKKIVYLDEEGNETTDQSKGVTYKLKDEDAFQEEYADYLNEDFVIDVTPATRDYIYGVRDLILNTNKEFSGVMAVRYDEWCSAFEDIH